MALVLIAVVAVVCTRSSPGRADAADLEGTAWQLVKFEGGDDTTLTPTERTSYTLEFNAGGRLNARIDCNRGRGTWKSSGSALELGSLALTRAACPSSSALAAQLVRHWPFIRSYVLKDGHLFLALIADGGIYEFEPAARAATASGTVIEGTATFRERMALPANAVFEAVLADVSRAGAPAAVIGRTRISSPGSPPYRFTIAYDPPKIDPKRSYAVRARILVGDKLLFTTDTSYPVLTRGNPSSVAVVLRRVGARPPAQSAPGPSAPSPLEKKRWTAVELGGRPVADDATRAPYLEFDAGRVAGFDGCNRLTGSYELSGEAIKFGAIASTRMACLDASDAAPRLHEALQKAGRWRISGDELELSSADGTRLARFGARGTP